MADNNLIEFGLGAFLFEDEYEELFQTVENYSFMTDIDDTVIDRIVMILLLNSRVQVIEPEKALRVIREEVGGALKEVPDVDMMIMLCDCVNQIMKRSNQ